MKSYSKSIFKNLKHVTDVVKIVNNNYEIVSGENKFDLLNEKPNTKCIHLTKKGSVLEAMNYVYDVIQNKILATNVNYFLVETNYYSDETKELHQYYDLIIVGKNYTTKLVYSSNYFVVRYDSLLKKIVYNEYKSRLLQSLITEIGDIFKNIDRNIYSNYEISTFLRKEYNIYQIKKVNDGPTDTLSFIPYVIKNKARQYVYTLPYTHNHIV